MKYYPFPRKGIIVEHDGEIEAISFKDYCRFKSKYVVNEDTGCWDWIAGISKSGYSKFRFLEYIIRGSRFSFLLHNGELDDYLDVCHSCDNTKCVNPFHLWQGTSSENRIDCVNKNRANVAKGISHHNSILNNEIVLYIRTMKKLGASSRLIRDTLIISDRVVRDVYNNHTWNHVK